MYYLIENITFYNTYKNEAIIILYVKMWADYVPTYCCNHWCITAMTLTSLAGGDSKRVTVLGSMLFLRSVSGTRVISGTDLKEVAGYKFEGKSNVGCNRLKIKHYYLQRISINL